MALNNLELERGADVLLLESGDQLLLENSKESKSPFRVRGSNLRGGHVLRGTAQELESTGSQPSASGAIAGVQYNVPTSGSQPSGSS